jgi:hypothetical protein
MNRGRIKESITALENRIRLKMKMSRTQQSHLQEGFAVPAPMRSETTIIVVCFGWKLTREAGVGNPLTGQSRMERLHLGETFLGVRYVWN